MLEWIEPLIKTLTTDSGFWNPIVWGIVFIVAFLVIYIIRGMGKIEYKKDTGQTQVFLSGNPEYDKEKMHVPGANVYWGFTEALKWLYNKFEKMHTGNVSDYVLWFVIIMGLFLVIIEVI